MLRTGFADEAKATMENILKKIGKEKIIVSCADYHNTFKEDIKDFLGVDVHTSHFFNELVFLGLIKLKM